MSTKAEQGSPDPGAHEPGTYESGPIRQPTVWGHEAHQQALADLAAAERFPHALLLSGPGGIGKATLAFWVVKGLLSNSLGHGSVTAPVPEIPQLAELAHSQVRVLYGGMRDPATGVLPETNIIPVAAVRQAMGMMTLASTGTWRVIVIDKAESLNIHGANGILKLLEEPPERSVFLVLSDAPGLVLPTIRSRCHAVKLRPLDGESMLAWAQQAYPDLAPGDRERLVVLSHGAPGVFRRWVEHEGLTLYQRTIEAVGACLAGGHDVAAALAQDWGRKENRGRFEVWRRLHDDWLCRMIRAQALGEPVAVFVEGEETVCTTLMQRQPVERMLAFRDQLRRLLEQAGPPMNLDRRQVVLRALTSYGELRVP